MKSEISRGIYLWIKDKYAEFTRRLSRLEVKKKVFMRPTNIKKNKKEDNF